MWTCVVDAGGDALWRSVDKCCGDAWKRVVGKVGRPIVESRCGLRWAWDMWLHCRNAWRSTCNLRGQTPQGVVATILAPLRGESWACVMEVRGCPSWACVVDVGGPGIVAMRGYVSWAPRTQCVVVPRVGAHGVHVAACIIRLHVTRPRGVQVGASRGVDSIAPKRSHRKERKQEKKEKIFLQNFLEIKHLPTYLHQFRSPNGATESSLTYPNLCIRLSTDCFSEYIDRWHE